jgi:hypothetical protein
MSVTELKRPDEWHNLGDVDGVQGARAGEEAKEAGESEGEDHDVQEQKPHKHKSLLAAALGLGLRGCRRDDDGDRASVWLQGVPAAALVQLLLRHNAVDFWGPWVC